MESRQVASPDDARRALEDVDVGRRALAERVAAPWWYRIGAATCTVGLFVGAGLTTAPGDEHSALGSLVTVVFAVVGPSALLAALRRATGVSVDRYASGAAAYFFVLIGLFIAALAVQLVAEVAFALPAAGVVAFIMTLVVERRINARLRERALTGAAAT